MNYQNVLIKKITILCIGLLLVIPLQVFAGAWTMQHGEIWAKASYLYQNSDKYFCGGDRAFCAAGDRAPYDPFIGGMSSNHTLVTDIYYGFTENQTVIVKIPFQFLTFENDFERFKSRGIGDIKVSIQQQLLRKSVAVAVQAGAKLPTGEFSRFVDRMPIGEGQWDFDLMGQIGYSLYPLPGYVNADIGYRFRGKNTDVDRTPGNEFFYNLEGGYRFISPLLLKLAVTGLIGDAPEVLGLTMEGRKPSIHYLAPEIFYRINSELELNAAWQYPLKGENYPAGNVFILGVIWNMHLFGKGE